MTKQWIPTVVLRVLPWLAVSVSVLVSANLCLSQSKASAAPRHTMQHEPEPWLPSNAVRNSVDQAQSSDSGPDVEQLSDQAKEALEARRWSEASATLDKLSKRLPTNPEVHANLGLAYYFQGDPAQALAAFRRALTLKPRMPQASVMIGICEAELGHNAEAIAILAPAFRKPSDPEMERLIGLHLQRSYAELKQFNKAITTGEELHKRYPDDAEILFQVSRLYADRSYELMTDLTRSAPDSAWVHYANAQVQESLARYDVAKREYENVLRRNPQMQGVHYRLGLVILLGAEHNPDSLAEATRAFQEELKIAPRNPEAEYELGEINREQGKYDLALEHFFQALSQQANFVEARIGLGRTLLKVGRTAQAIAHLKEASRLDPENKVPHALLANAYRSLSDSAAAQTEMDTYLKLSQTTSPNLIPGAGTPTMQQVDP
jgi:tetratricopeptide (TPR) repeat protein